MKVVEGDLIALAKEGEFDVIVHGCNCFNTMGAGIAKVIAREFPEAKNADLATPKGDRSKLGSISTAVVECGELQLNIINAYTQFHWRGAGQKVDYLALKSAFITIAGRYPGTRIGYPLIGAGLGGGDWRTIAPLIDHALTDHEHTLVILPGTKLQEIS